MLTLKMMQDAMNKIGDAPPVVTKIIIGDIKTYKKYLKKGGQRLQTWNGKPFTFCGTPIIEDTNYPKQSVVSIMSDGTFNIYYIHD